MRRPRAVVRELGTNTKFKYGGDCWLGVPRKLKVFLFPRFVSKSKWYQMSLTFFLRGTLFYFLGHESALSLIADCWSMIPQKGDIHVLSFPGGFYSKLGKFLSVSISISRTTIRRCRFLLFLLNDPATWDGRRVNIRVRDSSFNRKVMWCYRGVGIFEPPDFFP